MILFLLLMISENIGDLSLAELKKFTARSDVSSFTVRTKVYYKETNEVISNKINSYFFDIENKRSVVKEEHVPYKTCSKNTGTATIMNGVYVTDLFKKQDIDQWILGSIKKQDRFYTVSDGKKNPWACYLRGVGVATLSDNKVKNLTQSMKKDCVLVQCDIDHPLYKTLQMTVNPTKGYRLENYVLTTKSGVVISGEKYFSNKDPLILEKEIQYLPMGEKTQMAEHTFVYNPDFSQKEFDLSYYNIPKPIIEISYSYYPYFIILAALILLIVINLPKKNLS